LITPALLLQLLLWLQLLLLVLLRLVRLQVRSRLWLQVRY
jgi:hypothetical protein